MNYFIKQYKNSTNNGICSINLPSSKSESNRLLVMNALSDGKIDLNNLSSARDTQTLIKLLENENELNTFDVLDAGTAMRFLTAYFAVATKNEVALTGTERMKKRPIRILVNALRSIGAEISYNNEEGFPPLKIKPFQKQISSKISIPGNISSQYISALLMIAPSLPHGLEIKIEPPVFSKPYINMTLGLMELSGIQYSQNKNTISIQYQKYQESSQGVESDWSASSYWFSIIAQSEIGKKVFLEGLKSKSFQGDNDIKEIVGNFGVSYKFEKTGILLEKISSAKNSLLKLDFKKCPDLAQTVLPCAASLNVDLEMTGLESLRIKETDRISALQNELSKFNCKLTEPEKGIWKLDSSNFKAKEGIIIETYEDHRMAMGFAPLALKTGIQIKDIEVVNKSYPSFWEDLELFGFELVEQ
ncbi:3-phosphoshikimate 1-carboxyvinyltransferase [Marivirga tractuosa]|uniref:3-phosphoshikimate 1-carboxyvinyltransferase n=1 Tax=Marivirga tractuosa (strain ATCC 23168 / DSM 4126 / NBRC 15989 / NCIMB 1408 / VKM B-1430 / H-43) TaxID=643867 RepID=E4TLD7_MARTH|nr:3-phosphoshikimate 1-carboxyvinyltransferase [Marivirga tractuosa]ADR21258.1 3-phosphoshikimate 1-carboxyvinyltransferase [Marivirga tractuosa DSM 4126]BDD14288.1 3-phosphoshikimate 1-carboxyvinyltransferase [Marivirga tractuosa]